MITAKRTLAIASVIATMGASVLGATTVFAAQHGTGSEQRMSGLVNAIAQKFHLTPSDVQAVFDEQHSQMNVQMKKQSEDRLAMSLTQAVKDGKLTQAQATALTAKHAEFKTFEASLAGKTPAERATALKAQMATFAQWAKDNAIPEPFSSFGRGGMGMKMKGGMMHDGATHQGRGMRGRK